MYGPNTPKKWQQGYVNVLENTLADPDFQMRVTALRKMSGEEFHDAYLNLYSDYKLPSALWDCFKEYILTAKIDRSLIRPSVRIISDYDEVLLPAEHPDIAYKIYEQSQLVGKRSEVKLVFDVNATKAEIDQMLKDYRTDITKLVENAAASERKRLRARPTEERDQHILKLHAQGKDAREIADLLTTSDYPGAALTPADVRLIISRKK